MAIVCVYAKSQTFLGDQFELGITSHSWVDNVEIVGCLIFLYLGKVYVNVKSKVFTNA